MRSRPDIRIPLTAVGSQGWADLRRERNRKKAAVTVAVCAVVYVVTVAVTMMIL